MEKQIALIFFHEIELLYFFYLYVFSDLFKFIQIALDPGELSASAPSVPALLAREVLPRVADVLLILLIVKAERHRFKTIGLTRDNLVRSVSLLVVPLCAILFFRQGSPQEALLVEGVSYPWVGVAIALAVGVDEEIFFRGFPLFRLENLGTGKALFITAMAFALIHLPQSLLGNEMLIQTLLHLINPFADGIVFALVLSKTRNILPGILLHAFIDMPFFI